MHRTAALGPVLEPASRLARLEAAPAPVLADLEGRPSLYADGRWRALGHTDRAALLAHLVLTPALADDLLDLTWRTLPFYPEDTGLVRVRWRTDAQPELYFLAHDGVLFALKGRSPPIHEVNARAGVRIDRTTAVAYLRFFCFFVHGSEGGGPFHIVADAEDPLLPDALFEDPEAPIGELLSAPVLMDLPERAGDEPDDGGGLHCLARLIHARRFFEAMFAIRPDGAVEMIDDTPLLTDLAAPVYALISRR